MIVNAITFLTFVSSVFVGVVVLYALIGSRIYDVVLYRNSATQNEQPYQHLPFITIIVPVRNAEAEIIQFLGELVAVTDRRSTILIVDAASTDQTVRKVRTFAKQYRNRRVHIRAFRNETDVQKAEKNVEHKLIRGDIVVRIGINERIDRGTLSRIAHCFAAHKSPNILIPRQTIIFDHTLISTISIYISYLRQTFLKAHDGFRVVSVPVRPQIMTIHYYQRLKHKNWDTSLVTGVAYYRDDIIIYGHAPRHIYGFLKCFLVDNYLGVQSLFSQLQDKPNGVFNLQSYMDWLFAGIKISFRFIAIFIPVSLGYFIYLALALHTPIYLLACGVGVILCLGFMLSEDFQLSSVEKLRLLVPIPAVLFTFYVLSWLMVVAWIRQGITSFASN